MAEKERVNILLVDDQPAKLLAYEAILSELDENLIRVGSGGEALEQLLKTEIAVLLVDVCMPELDGFELAEMIRQHPRYQRTSIIFVSAVQMSELDRLRGFECGAVDYVSVPVDPNILRARVAVFCDLYRKTRQLERLNAELEQRVDSRTRELAESEQRMRLAQKHAAIGSFDWNLKTGAWSWSPETFDLYGIDPAATVTPEAWEAAIHPDDRARVAGGVREVIERGEDWSDEYRIVHPVRGERWLAGVGRTVDDATGKPERLTGILMDVTERKRMEEALREADRRKDEFLAVLAHELRNPLAPIRNASRILGMGGPKELAWGRDVIDRQVSHLTRLVDDLLDVSRITSGKLQLHRAPVTLSEVLEGAVETIQPLIEQNEHELTVTLPSTPIHLDADVVRLTQVFTNLLANSAKYTPRGGRIWLVAEREGDQAVVRVRDEGVGIPAEELPHLFQMFYRPRDTEKSLQGGLGIGLTLVHRLVAMHGGTVTASSPGVDRGSEFVVCVPVAAAPSQPAAADGQTSARPAARSRRVLVADDNRDSNESLALLLRLEGHEVETAHDGLEAVQAAERFRPDVALLDIGMPTMDGYEVARRIRQRPWGAGVVLMALTGWGQAADRSRSRDAGFDVHLTKPVDLNELMERLSQSREESQPVREGT